jgi:hypothetical protein
MKESHSRATSASLTTSLIFWQVVPPTFLWVVSCLQSLPGCPSAMATRDGKQSIKPSCSLSDSCASWLPYLVRSAPIPIHNLPTYFSKVMATSTSPNLYLITAAHGWSTLPSCARDVFTEIVGCISYSACTYTNVPVTNIVSCFCHTVQQSISSNLRVFGGEQYYACPRSELPSATDLLTAYCTANDRGQLATGTLATVKLAPSGIPGQ